MDSEALKSQPDQILRGTTYRIAWPTVYVLVFYLQECSIYHKHRLGSLEECTSVYLSILKITFTFSGQLKKNDDYCHFNGNVGKVEGGGLR